MRTLPSKETTKLLVAYLHAGGFPHVAAAAAGIPIKLFRGWMKEGRKENAQPLLKEFYLAVSQAQAQARLRAEITAFQEKPLEWLKHGPGKGASCGWGARKKISKGSSIPPLLEIPGLAKHLGKLLELLEPYPDARKAMGEALEKTPARLD